MTHPAPRWTAVCLAFAAAATWFLWPDANGQAFALDKMLDTIVEARSATFEMTLKMDGQPEQKLKGMFLAPARFRQELGGGMVNVVDWSERKMVGLDSNTKQATVFNLVRGEGRKMPGNQFEELRETLRKAKAGQDVTATSLGEAEIGGRKVVGFRFVTSAQTLTVWGDAETELPVKLEGTFFGPPRTEFTMTDYQFNVDLDKSLFALAPPDGWTIHTLDVDVSPPAEADLVKCLKRYAELSDGAFPDSLTPLLISPLIARIAVSEGPPSEERVRELMKEAITIGRGLEFALQLPREADAHYAGNGAKLGDTDRIVFWHKPKDARTYRVIRGDLTVQESETAPQVEGAAAVWGPASNAGAAPRE
jgi:outer membrane lipoprotein-sorting protein